MVTHIALESVGDPWNKELAHSVGLQLADNSIEVLMVRICALSLFVFQNIFS